MSVTVNLVSGRRRVRDDARSPPRPSHRRRSSELPPKGRTGDQDAASARRWRSPPGRLRIVIPNDTAAPTRDDRLPPPSDARPSLVLMSKRFQNDESAASAKPELASKKFRPGTKPATNSSSFETRPEPPDIPVRRRADPAAPDPEPRPVAPARTRSLKAHPELFGDGARPGMLLVQNLPLDVTGQEVVMNVFPEHDILSADLYQSDDLKPYAEIVFLRLDDAIGALKRHLGQVYRGHSLRITLLNNYKV